jgi:1-acyl-sn-glycerol-3-phosphate acyltransferase
MPILRALLVVVATVFFGTIGILVSLFDAIGNRQMVVARAWGRVLLAVSGVKVCVEGLDQIAPDGSYILVSNHLSYMDTPVMLSNIPVQFRFLAKKGLFQIPLLGTHLARAGHIPVFRDDPRAAVRTMGQAAQAVRERGTSLLVFPEGGRSRDGELAEFKEGAAYIAIKAGVPLVPVALKGTRDVLPFGSGRIRAGKVSMRIGAPVPTSHLKLHDRERVTQDLRNRIAALLDAEKASPCVSS